MRYQLGRYVIVFNHFKDELFIVKIMRRAWKANCRGRIIDTQQRCSCISVSSEWYGEIKYDLDDDYEGMVLGKELESYNAAMCSR